MAQTEEYRRNDGRGATTMRKLGIEIGGLSKSDGSSRFGFGAEQVIAGFHGPTEADRRDELIDRAALRITHRPLESIPGVSSKAIAMSLEAIYLPLLNLHAYPKSSLQLTLQSNTSGSSSLNYTSMAARAASINAATLAILDAGSIDMLGVPVACAIAVVPTRPKSRRYDFDASYVGLDGESAEVEDEEDDEEEEVTMILDPSLEEEKLAKSKFVFSWAFGSGLGRPNGKGPNSEAECVYTESEGSFDDVQFQKAYNASRFSCEQILSEVRQKAGERR